MGACPRLIGDNGRRRCPRTTISGHAPTGHRVRRVPDKQSLAWESGNSERRPPLHVPTLGSARQEVTRPGRVSGRVSSCALGDRTVTDATLDLTAMLSDPELSGLATLGVEMPKIVTP